MAEKFHALTYPQDAPCCGYCSLYSFMLDQEHLYGTDKTTF